jgi:hypothetical protein
MRRKTIIAPSVIVRPSRAQRLLRLALLLTAFVLAIGYSYDYGRRHPLSVGSATNVADSTAAQRIQALERTRDALQARVDELEAARPADRLRPDPAPKPLPQPTTKPASTAAPDPDPAPKIAATGTAPGITAAAAAPAGGAATLEPRLQLADVRLTPTATAGRFRFHFSVRRSGADTGPLAGNIWIAVEGLAHGKPTRLPLQKVSENRRPYLKMRVQVQQDIDEILALPANFVPRSILIEAKPFAQHHPEASGKFDWGPDN